MDNPDGNYAFLYGQGRGTAGAGWGGVSRGKVVGDFAYLFMYSIESDHPYYTKIQ